MNFSFFNHPVLDLPLTDVLRPEIALSLQQMMKIYTVGAFLRAWDNPVAQVSIEHLFDTAEQARHAATLCTLLHLSRTGFHRYADIWSFWFILS